MSDTTATTLAVTATSPLTESMHKCSRQGCSHWFRPGSGFVPDLRTLYWAIREGDVQKSRPLARAEVLSQEICGSCRKLATFPVYSTEGTLRLMERWAAENIERRERALDRQAAFEARQHARSLTEAIKREGKSPMNALFATLEKRKAKHGKTGRRRGRSERREAAVLPTSNPSPKQGKGNKKREQGGGKRKGRG